MIVSGRESEFAFRIGPTRKRTADASGAVGHGSRFIADTAIERLIGVSNKALEYRTAQEQQLGYGWANGAAGCKHCEAKKLGDVTSLNLTMLQARLPIGQIDLPWPLFLGCFCPVLRRVFAILSRCPASLRQDGENGREMAENGRNLGEKRARNSGG